jgi:hypothetical protein
MTRFVLQLLLLTAVWQQRGQQQPQQLLARCANVQWQSPEAVALRRRLLLALDCVWAWLVRLELLRQSCLLQQLHLGQLLLQLKHGGRGH